MKGKNKLSKLEVIKLIFLGCCILSGSFILFTLIKLVPVIVMIAAVVTGSESLIYGIPGFVYFWFGLSILFISSLIIFLITQFYINKKGKRI